MIKLLGFAKKILEWLLQMVGISIGAATQAWAWRLAAVTLAFAIFYAAFWVSWGVIADLIGVGVSNMVNGGDSIAQSGFVLFQCLLPSDTASALTLVMATAMQAVIVKLTRQILFAKIV